MTKINVKGHEIEAITIKDSFNRRTTQFKNNIVASLRQLGLTADDIDFDSEKNGIRKATASVSWYFEHKHLHFSHSSRNKYVENIYVVFKIIDLEVAALIEERITVDEFMNEFSEEMDIKERRKEARETLGLGENEHDMKIIDKAYKDLAKKHHPDTDGGDTEKFKEINQAHKVLKRELR